MNNCLNVLEHLFKALKIRYNKNFLENHLLSNPSYPSLGAITDVLKDYNITHLATQIDSSKLPEIPLPCIVHFKNDGGMFYVLSSYNEKTITYLDNAGNKLKVDHQYFLENWSGICILQETNSNSIEPGFIKRYRASVFMRIVLWLIPTLFLIWIFNTIHYPNYQETKWLLLTLAGTKIVGLVTCLALLIYGMDNYYPRLNGFCSGSTSGGCKKVLESKKASILNGLIGLDILGFSYFFGTIVFLVVSILTDSNFVVIFYLSLMLLPFAVVSFYYQGFVLKAWCRFCIIVQVTVIFEAILSVISLPYLRGIEINSLLLLIVLMLIPLPIWNWLQPILKENKAAQNNLRSLRSALRKPEIFDILLRFSMKLKESPFDVGIQIKIPKAKHNVLIICNPFCPHCERAQPILDNLISAEKINLQIILIGSQEASPDEINITKHLLAIYIQQGQQKLSTAISYWYASCNHNYQQFLATYLEKSAIVYHPRRIKVSHPCRVKVNHLRRRKVNH